MSGVRTLNIVFASDDYARIEAEKEKSGLGWRAFILKAVLGE
jgi:hypothetical protein